MCHAGGKLEKSKIIERVNCYDYLFGVNITKSTRKKISRTVVVYSGGMFIFTGGIILFIGLVLAGGIDPSGTCFNYIT